MNKDYFYVEKTKVYRKTFWLLTIFGDILSGLLEIGGIVCLFLDKNIFALKYYYFFVFLCTGIGLAIFFHIINSILLRFVYKEDINYLNQNIEDKVDDEKNIKKEKVTHHTITYKGSKSFLISIVVLVGILVIAFSIIAIMSSVWIIKNFETYNLIWIKKIKYCVVAIACVIIVAGLGSVFVNVGMEWFNGLIKPSQWIPNILIPIVWTIIYLLSAVILWVLIKNYDMSKYLLALFVFNGILNILWCLIFFTLHLTLFGNVIIIINLICGWLLIVELFKYRNILYNILIIYPIWLSFATTLSLSLWILN